MMNLKVTNVDEGEKLIESQSVVECEINSDRGDLLIRNFWNRSTDRIIDIRICDVNQVSYLTRKPAPALSNLLNWGEKALYFFFRLLWRLAWKGSRCSSQTSLQELADKRHRPYAQISNFDKNCFAISLVRVKNKHLRGSRTPCWLSIINLIFVFLFFHYSGKVQKSRGKRSR